MHSRTQILLATVIAVCLSSAPLRASQRMVGLVPTDGEAKLVKRFLVPAGTVVLGASFANNDCNTVFPEVALVWGAVSALSEGDVVASATGVQEVALGEVNVLWSEPIRTTQVSEYLVAVRLPAGYGRQGPGVGPGIGADDTERLCGSYIAWGPDGDLVPIQVDLAIRLLTGGSNASKAKPPESDDDRASSTFLDVKSPGFSASAQIAFGFEATSEVVLVLFDVTGRRVRGLLQTSLGAGAYEIAWDGRNDSGNRVATGVYLVTLRTGKDFLARKIVFAQ